MTTITPSALLDRPPAEEGRDTARAGAGAAGWLAAAVVAQPVLLGINSVFHPDVELDAAELLAGAAEGPATWFAVHLVAALGALVGAPAAVGIRRLLVGRGRRIADAALACALVAGVVLSLSFVAEGSLLRVLASSDLDTATAESVVERYLETPEFLAIGVGFLTAIASAALFAWALLLERRVPRWMPLALLFGTVLTSVAPPGTPVGPVGFGVVAVGAVGLARHLLRDRRPGA